MVRDFIIITTIAICILLWHPWTNIDESVKESIVSQLRLKRIELEETWQPFGTYVDVYGIEHNKTRESYIGFFYVGYWGSVESIHTSYGVLDPESFDSLIKEEPKNETNETIPEGAIRVGESFTLNFSITPSFPVKAWETNLIYNSSVLKANFIEWGDYFGNLTVFRSPDYELENGTITKMYELTIEKGKTVQHPGVLFYVNFTAISKGTAIVFAESFGVTDGLQYVDVKLDRSLQMRRIV